MPAKVFVKPAYIGCGKCDATARINVSDYGVFKLPYGWRFLYSEQEGSTVICRECAKRLEKAK